MFFFFVFMGMNKIAKDKKQNYQIYMIQDSTAV